MVSGTEASAQVIRLAWPELGSEELAAIAEVLASGNLTMGPKVAVFEAVLADECGTEYAVAVRDRTERRVRSNSQLDLAVIAKSAPLVKDHLLSTPHSNALSPHFLILLNSLPGPVG